MAPEADSVDSDAQADDERVVPTVTVHETKPGRLVFTELDNEDGWVATDLAVESPR
jgi:hypothetical protein